MDRELTWIAGLGSDLPVPVLPKTRKPFPETGLKVFRLLLSVLYPVGRRKNKSIWKLKNKSL
jgi:hypothetical protein